MSPSIRELALRLTLAEGGLLEQAAEAAGRLSDIDRRACLSLLHGQRLIPLVTHRLQRADLTTLAGLGGPETFSNEIQSWKEITRRLRLVHLQVSRRLDQSGIEVIGLKGSDLAWNVYPEPWLRPQRDLDLLVPEDRLAEALHRLEEMGCRLDEGSRHPAHPGFWWHHHCTLVHPLGVKLELHRGLWRMPVDRWPKDFSLRGDFHDPDSMERYRRRQGELIFLAPEFLHLHCLVHHLHSHLTNVGPLGLHDLKLLVAWPSVDPAQLEQEARRIGVPGLPRLAASLVAWGSGECADPPYPAPLELLFMDRFRLFSLQMGRRSFSRMTEAWWRVHRRGYRWSEAEDSVSWPRAVGRALVLIPGLALQPGFRRLLVQKLTGRSGDHRSLDADTTEAQTQTCCRNAASQLERLIRTPS